VTVGIKIFALLPPEFDFPPHPLVLPPPPSLSPLLLPQSSKVTPILLQQIRVFHLQFQAKVCLEKNKKKQKEILTVIFQFSPSHPPE